MQHCCVVSHHPFGDEPSTPSYPPPNGMPGDFLWLIFCMRSCSNFLQSAHMCLGSICGAGVPTVSNKSASAVPQQHQQYDWPPGIAEEEVCEASALTQPRKHPVYREACEAGERALPAPDAALNTSSTHRASLAGLHQRHAVLVDNRFSSFSGQVELLTTCLAIAALAIGMLYSAILAPAAAARGITKGARPLATLVIRSMLGAAFCGILLARRVRGYSRALSGRQWIALAMACCVLGAAINPNGDSAHNTRSRFTRQLWYFKTKTRKRYKRKRGRLRRAKSETARATTRKRGDCHFHQAGGASGSFLLFKEAAPPYLARPASRASPVRGDEHKGAMHLEPPRASAVEATASETQPLRTPRRRTKWGTLRRHLKLAMLVAVALYGPPSTQSTAEGSHSKVSRSVDVPTAGLCHDPAARNLTGTHGFGSPKRCHLEASWRPSSPWAGIRVGQAPRPGPANGSEFDEIDAAILEHNSYQQELQQEDECMEPPGLMSDSDSDDEDNKTGKGEIIPRWDVGLNEKQREEWAAAEKSLKCSQGKPASGDARGKTKGKGKGKDSPLELPSALDGDFCASKAYQGAREGYEFCTSGKGIGYHKKGTDRKTPNDEQRDKDERKSAFEYDLKVATSSQTPAEMSTTTRARRPRNGNGSRSKKEAKVNGEEITFAATTTLADQWWKKHGLWAIDSSNPNAFDAARRKILRRSKASAVMLQETRLKTKDEIAAAKRAARREGWSAHFEPARHTDADRGSGGCGVAVKKGSGISAISTEDLAPDTRHRLAAAWVDVIIKGGITLVSVYMADSEGLSEKNLAVLGDATALVRSLRSPWIMAGDWNMDPRTLNAAGWVDTTGGVIIAPALETCNKSTYDFFVVSKELQHAVAGLQRIDDGGTKPHFPVRLLLKGNGRSYAVRKLVRPKKVEAALPHGPGNLPPSYSEVTGAAPTTEGINTAMKKWYELARQEWADLTGASLEYRKPHFKWSKAAGDTCKAGETASTLALTWRQLARRAEDLCRLSKLPGSRSSAQVDAYYAHVYAIKKWTTKLPNAVPEHETALVNSWASHVDRARTSNNWQSLGALVKLADKKADKLEQSARTQRIAEWRTAIGGKCNAAGTKTPTKLAYRWLKGFTGWTTSPVQSSRLNDGVPDEPTEDAEGEDPGEDEKDELTPGEVHSMPKIKVYNGSATDIPLCDQATVDLEAEKWAKLWNEGASYPRLDFEQPPMLDDLLLHTIRAAAASFPLQTGVGADNVAPRALLRLSDGALLALASLMLKMEEVGEWAEELDLVLIVLLDKADGGRRPIGLFPTVVRVWMRARAAHARAWEATNASKHLYGSAGMGAQRAAWVEAFCAEAAALDTEEHAQALMDLTKAFEAVPHDLLLDAAKRRGFPIALLRMSIAAYRLKRAIGIDGVYSRQIQATRGITAGSGLATTELRLLLLDVIEPTKSRWGGALGLTLYVDDLTISIRGARRHVAQKLAAAVDFVTQIFEEQLRLNVSKTKSVVVASRPSVAREVAKRSKAKSVKPTKSAKLLGTAAAGGKRRSTKIAKNRLEVFKSTLKRMWALRKNGANTRQMARAAGTAAVCYGDDIQGVSNSALSDRRSVLARAAAPAGSGKNPLKVLYALDGANGSLDPSFDAHLLPMKHWALAWWEAWIEPCHLEKAFAHRMQVSQAHRTQWARAAGPIAALDLSLQRIGWIWLTASTVQDHQGGTWDCRKDPPSAITKAMRKAVKQHRLRELAAMHPDLIPDAADTGNGRSAFGLQVIDFASTLSRLVNGRIKSLKDTPEWLPEHAAALLSTMSNGQWTQSRRHAVKKWNIASDLCQLCQEHCGTQLHRKRCRVTKPSGGWTNIPQAAKLAASRIGNDRRELLEKTGLLTVKVPNLEPRQQDTFRWYSQAPDCTRCDLNWIIDGSALNTKWSTLATFGFGIVVTADNGDLVAWGGGVPPAWVDSASASEAWALATVSMLAVWPPRILTDCLGLLHTSEAGTAAATKSSRQLARTWAVIANQLDGDISKMTKEKRLRWMPAHQSVAAIGVACKSDGKPITSLEWRANRLVDAVAKNEATRGAAPQATIDLINSATALVKHSAAQMGTATHFANNHVTESTLEDGTTVRKTTRDAQEPPPRAAAGKQPTKPKAPQPEQPPPDVSDWDTADELNTYGPDTRRARRSAQKKARREAAAKKLNELLAATADTLVKSCAVEETRSERRLEAARGLLEAARANCTDDQLSRRPVWRSNGHMSYDKVDDPAKNDMCSCVSCGVMCSCVSSASSCARDSLQPGTRSRPIKDYSRTTASSTRAAVQALLNG